MINGLHIKDEGAAPKFRIGRYQGKIYVWQRDDTVPPYAPGYHAYRPRQPPCRTPEEALGLLRQINRLEKK